MIVGNKLKGQHILITGGARGIGFEISRRFLLEGGLVTVYDNNESNLNTAFQELDSFAPGMVSIDLVDISDRDAVHRSVKKTWGIAPIDVLVNNAGIAMETAFLDITDQEWNKILNINLTGTFIVSQEVGRLMTNKKSGVVINMSSKNGLDGEQGYAHYNASKAGIILLTKTMAIELAPHNIRVNAVCPGYIETPMSKEIDSPEMVAKFSKTYIPLNRAGQVEEVGAAFLFLADRENSFMTGQTIVVDGGQLAGQTPW